MPSGIIIAPTTYAAREFIDQEKLSLSSVVVVTSMGSVDRLRGLHELPVVYLPGWSDGRPDFAARVRENMAFIRPKPYRVSTEVFISWDFQGEDFTVHASYEGALDKARHNATRSGLPDDQVALIDGEYDELDGFTVERFNLLP